MDNVMGQENIFSYKYSAKESKEVEEIRKRYLPQSESKLDELRRLDAQVQNSGVVPALCVGIISSLVFGTGMCLAMQVLGSGIVIILLGVVVGIIGIVGMMLAYPVYRAKQRTAKEKFSSIILELVDELAENN